MASLTTLCGIAPAFYRGVPAWRESFALIQLQPFIGRDGGGSLTMRELIAAQKKLTATPSQ
jgi:hypothetical protein